MSSFHVRELLWRAHLRAEAEGGQNRGVRAELETSLVSRLTELRTQVQFMPSLCTWLQTFGAL